MTEENSNPLSLKGERIAKVIARAGVCSRRDAEKLIAEGRVTVDGETIDSPALNVLPSDLITVDGKALPDRQPPRLWKYHKHRGQMTTHKDPEGRPTVFDALPKGTPRVISVGRLDYNTEGVLLLTNDGELARYLEQPETGYIRRYKVRVYGRVDEKALENLREGPVIDGIHYGPVDAMLDVQKGANAWINVSIREGKNREVRRVMESLGYEVTRLIRTDYGPVQLGKLPKGELEEIPRKMLIDWFGGKVAGIKSQKERTGFAAAKTPSPHRTARDKDSRSKQGPKRKTGGRKPHADRQR